MLGMLFLLVGSVSAISVNYYYHPDCGHCNSIVPFINQMTNNYQKVNWNILDVSKGSYEISGTPTLVLTTNDDRDITLVGSQEIPRWLGCELNEMSTIECQTVPELNCETNSFFVR